MKTRLAYTKKKEARYIAHLDLTRVFDRALRRAQIEVNYSEGFNPHPKISFGPPLPVGVEGVQEYVDIDLKEPESISRETCLKEAVGKLQKQLPEGVGLIGCGIRPEGSKALMAIITLARYKIIVPLNEKIDPLAVQEVCDRWLSRKEVIVIRCQKGKKSERNIRPFVKRIEVLSEEASMEIELRLDIKTGNEGSVRPLEVMQSISTIEGLPVDLAGISTIREGLYIEDKDGGMLDPIEYIGKV